MGARAAAPPARPGQARGVSVTTSLVLCPRSLAAGRLPRSSCPPHSARLGPGPAAPRRGTQFLLPSPGHSPHGSGLGLPAGGHRRTAIVPGRVPGGRASAAGLPVPGAGCGRGAPRAAPSSRAGRLRRSGEPLPPRCAALSAFLTSSRVWAFTLRLKTSREFVLICVRRSCHPGGQDSFCSPPAAWLLQPGLRGSSPPPSWFTRARWVCGPPPGPPSPGDRGSVVSPERRRAASQLRRYHLRVLGSPQFAARESVLGLALSVSPKKPCRKPRRAFRRVALSVQLSSRRCNKGEPCVP